MMGEYSGDAVGVQWGYIRPLHLQDDVNTSTDRSQRITSNTKVLLDEYDSMTCRYPLYIEEQHRTLGRDATFPWSRALTHPPR